MSFEPQAPHLATPYVDYSQVFHVAVDDLEFIEACLQFINFAFRDTALTQVSATSAGRCPTIHAQGMASLELWRGNIYLLSSSECGRLTHHPKPPKARPSTISYPTGLIKHQEGQSTEQRLCDAGAHKALPPSEMDMLHLLSAWASSKHPFTAPEK